MGRYALIALVAWGCTTGGPRALPETGFDAQTDAAAVDAGPDVMMLECSEGMTIGQPCANDAQCDDGCFCNGAETCGEDGTCSAGALDCNDDIECTLDMCDENLDRCVAMPSNDLCSDGNACNGAEICDMSLGCRPSAPLYCNDESSCTVDSCDEALGCVFAARDLDGDGFTSGACGGLDCDDDPRFGTEIYPGAPEDCRNRRDDNCDGARDYNDLTCNPENGTCEDAEVIPGPGTYSGATRGLTADATLGCKDTGPDAFFRFTLDETMDVQVTASGGSGTAVAIRSAAACETGPDIRCNNFTPATMLQRSLAPGEYVIIVKQTTGGTFDLNVRFEPPTVIPPVDLCNAGTEEITAGGTYTGMFVEVEDDYDLSCNSQPRRDAVYKLVLTETKDVVLRGSTTGSGFTSTYLTLVTDCDDPDTTVQCRSGNPAEVRRRELAAGTYFIIIESSRTDSSMWSLDVEITDPTARDPGDACSTALDITDGPETATIGSIGEIDAGASCGSTSSFARDLIFFFTLTEVRDVDLTVTSPSRFSTAVAVATECGVAGSEIRCRSGSISEMQTFRSLPAGTYYVIAHTTSSSGTITAQIETRDPTPIPPNDICTGAIDITGGTFRRDTLTGFEDDSSTCRSGYPDAFYEFTISTPSRASITVSPTSGSSSYTVTLRDSCSSGTNIECRTGNPAAISRDLDPGDYVLIVEAPFSVAGDFDLAASFFPLP